MTTRSANANTRSDDDDDVTMSSSRDCSLDQCVDPSVNPDSVPDHQNDSGEENGDITSSSLINKAELIKEQRDDETLRGCWKLAERGRGNFLIDDGMMAYYIAVRRSWDSHSNSWSYPKVVGHMF